MTIELENGKPPEWMIALENKQKRHHKLAHDVGAGAPCLNCNEGCAGLDLHFWRKICRNCKCKKELHDVKEENSFEQFEILFGDNLKSGDRVKQLSLDLKLDDILNAKETQVKDSKSTSSDDNLVFDWIPTDVPAKLASEYLQQLPLEKLPITGSAGAMFRRQQLQKQIPLHDFKAESCNDLTDEETKAFGEYVDNLKNNAVGKGQIIKIFQEGSADNDSILGYNSAKLPAFSNNLNFTPKPFKSNYDPVINSDDSFPPPPLDVLHGKGLSLRTPSAFAPYKPSLGISYPNELKPCTDSAPYATEHLNINQQTENSTSITGLAAQYSQMNISSKGAVPYTLENKNYAKQTENSTSLCRPTTQYSKTIENGDAKALDTRNNNWYHNNDQNESTESLKPSDIIRKLNSRPTSPATNVIVQSNLVNKNIRQLNDAAMKNVDAKFLKTGTLEQFQALSTSRPFSPATNAIFKSHPVNENIPMSNDPAIKNVDAKFLKMGTPEQFQALSSYVSRTPQVSNTLINPEAKRNLNDSVNASKARLDPSTVSVYDNDVGVIDPYQQVEKIKKYYLQQCHHCKLPAYPGQVVVVAERAGIEVIWHPQCFVCVNCQELLVDLVYFFHNGEVYCGRHYAEELKIPRCFACDELIFLKEYTVAEGQSFHVKHFCCFECDIPLGGMQYIPKDGNPVCLSCYEIKYGKKCNYCDKMIKAGDSRVSWKELSWHAYADCFKCFQCSKSLLGGKFMVKDNKPLCSKECAIKTL